MVAETFAYIRKFFRRLYAVVVVTSVASCSHDHAINYHIRRRCETDHKFLDDCNLVYLPVDSNRDPRGRDSDSRIVLRHRLMSRLLYICLLLNILSLVLAQPLCPFVTSSGSISNSSDSELTVPMPPRHTSFEYSCVCGAGFTQAQHLTRHKTDCSPSKEIAQRAFEKGRNHKPSGTNLLQSENVQKAQEAMDPALLECS